MWPEARGQVLATRLAVHLGSPTIGRLLLRRAKRRWPDDPTVHYFYWAERWELLDDIERYYPLACRHKTRDWLGIIAQRRCDLACSLGRPDSQGALNVLH